MRKNIQNLFFRGIKLSLFHLLRLLLSSLTGGISMFSSSDKQRKTFLQMQARNLRVSTPLNLKPEYQSALTLTLTLFQNEYHVKTQKKLTD